VPRWDAAPPRCDIRVVLTMGPRFRGDDADFHCSAWTKGPWKLAELMTPERFQRPPGFRESSATTCLQY
jgi:hypothetical protein